MSIPAQLLLDPRLKILADSPQDPTPPENPLEPQPGHIHEWFLNSSLTTLHNRWFPPLQLLSTLARELAAQQPDTRIAQIVWIGRLCWPTFQILSDPAAHTNLLQRSLFLDPLSNEERFWAIGQALRCKGVSAVIADASSMSDTVSRRLQLAAESGRTIGLFARPPWEMHLPSWASARWLATPRLSQHFPSHLGSSWNIELISRKGRQPGQDAPRQWVLDCKYQVFRGTSAFHLSADVEHRSPPSQSITPPKKFAQSA